MAYGHCSCHHSGPALALVANIGTHFVGRPFDDAIAVMWELSWARDALGRGDLSLLAEDVYFPYGYHTASDAQPIWWAFLAAPLVSILVFWLLTMRHFC